MKIPCSGFICVLAIGALYIGMYALYQDNQKLKKLDAKHRTELTITQLKNVHFAHKTDEQNNAVQKANELEKQLLTARLLEKKHTEELAAYKHKEERLVEEQKKQHQVSQKILELKSSLSFKHQHKEHLQRMFDNTLEDANTVGSLLEDSYVESRKSPYYAKWKNNELAIKLIAYDLLLSKSKFQSIMQKYGVSLFKITQIKSQRKLEIERFTKKKNRELSCYNKQYSNYRNTVLKIDNTYDKKLFNDRKEILRKIDDVRKNKLMSNSYRNQRLEILAMQLRQIENDMCTKKYVIDRDEAAIELETVSSKQHVISDFESNCMITVNSYFTAINSMLEKIDVKRTKLEKELLDIETEIQDVKSKISMLESKEITYIAW